MHRGCTFDIDYPWCEAADASGTYVGWCRCDPGCADSTSWYRKKSKNTCEKYVAKKAAKNCLKTDDDGVYAFEACPETCGSCGEACADDATWYKKKTSQNCRWVVEGDGLERCEEKSAADGTYAYEACRFACRSCDATVCSA